MHRRKFLTALSLVVAGDQAKPIFAANQPRHIIGFFNVPIQTRTELIDSFKSGLREFGLIPGRNVRLDFKTTDSKNELLDRVANEIISENPDVVVTWGLPPVQAIKRATKTIPVVMATVGDPVEAGVVSSLAKPGGNITGFTLASVELAAKRTQLFKELHPKLNRIGFLIQPDTGLEAQFEEIKRAAAEIEIESQAFFCRSPSEIRDAIAAASAWRATGLITSTVALFAGRRAEIAKACLEFRIALAGPTREFAVSGALFCYGPSILDTTRRSASYVDKILKGESPSELPIQRPDRFDLVINLKTASALDLPISPMLLARADEVIE